MARLLRIAGWGGFGWTFQYVATTLDRTDVAIVLLVSGVLIAVESVLEG